MNEENEILHRNDIQKVLGFGRDKTRRMLNVGVLPAVKINADFIIMRKDLEDWMRRNAGKKLRF